MPKRTRQGGKVKILEPDACWGLLKTESLGRLAIAAERVEIYPVNFLVHDHSIFFASAPGSKLMELTENPGVAFEVDGQLADDLWSVVIHGRAKRLARDSDIESSGILQHKGWHPTEKYNYVRITPDEITGRRFPRQETT
jgi:nitroimidazol reductase NimA-like FMN-containing flavoprotein (pyridoxamine 5'-phosphate oxidase superfamily)